MIIGLHSSCVSSGSSNFRGVGFAVTSFICVHVFIYIYVNTGLRENILIKKPNTRRFVSNIVTVTLSFDDISDSYCDHRPVVLQALLPLISTIYQNIIKKNNLT